MMRTRPSAVPHLAFALRSRQHRLARPALLSSKLPQPQHLCSFSSRPCLYATRSIPNIPQTQLRSRPRRTTVIEEDEYEDGRGHITAGRYRRPIWIFIWGVCIFGFGVSTYLSFNYASHRRAVQATERLDLPQNADVSSRWRDSSRNFDEEVDLSEKWLLLRAKRKRLVNQAYGNVLEVSCGTGRNLDLYDLRPFDPTETASTGRSRDRIISSMTFNDQSEVMIDHAVAKFKDMEANRKPRERFAGSVRFIVGDAAIPGLISRPEGGYDTIVQTMGVCSVSDATNFLRRLGDLCRQPGEPSPHLKAEDDDGRGGKILLLEHGRGQFDFINRFLDDGAKMHAAHYGCWWNKDVAEVIEQSGLVVERIRRYNFGTTWEIVLRPAPKPS